MDNKGSLTWLWVMLIILGTIIAFFATAIFIIFWFVLAMGGEGEWLFFIAVIIIAALVVGLKVISKKYGETENYRKLHGLLNLAYVFVFFYTFVVILFIQSFISDIVHFTEFYKTNLVISVIISIILADLLRRYNKPKKR